MLDEKTKQRIRSLHAEHGLSVSVLAERFGVRTPAIREVLGEARPRRETGSEILARAFACLEAAALKGDRCPMNDALPGGAKSVSILARQGKILVEIYVQNFRRITLMEGPHKGLKTADAPQRQGRAAAPYAIVGTEGKRLQGAISIRGGLNA